MIENTPYFDENDYEFNKESNIGILIIHGFTSTTYEVRDLESNKNKDMLQ